MIPGLSPDFLTLSLPDLLAYVTAGKITLDVARKRIRELLNKNQYGFSPDPGLAFKLHDISKSELYKRMKDCIGNHRYLSLIKLGLRFEELSYEGNSHITIDNIKNDVYKKYGSDGLNVLKMGGTGALVAVIKYLDYMKLSENWGQEYTADKFDAILDTWKNITIFHQFELGEESLKKTVVTYMDAHHEIFFVFSIGTASGQAKRAIASLNNNQVIKKKGYAVRNIRNEDLVGREHHIWVFENRYNFDKITL